MVAPRLTTPATFAAAFCTNCCVLSRSRFTHNLAGSVIWHLLAQQILVPPSGGIDFAENLTRPDKNVVSHEIKNLMLCETKV
jgi:hypothetical protein